MKSSLYFDQVKDFTLKRLDFDKLSKGKVHYGAFDLFSDAAHRISNLPAIVAKGAQKGPTIGLLGCVHGNELQGISVIHHLMDQIDPTVLSGNVVAIPVVNMPGYLTKSRRFIDSIDLNRVMPGKKHGKPSEMFAYRLMHNVITEFDYMIDLHTASFGRINSHYVRADLSIPEVRKMAILQDSSIILNTKQPEGSFRYAANDVGIHTITVELGDPQKFQQTMIDSGINGVENVMIDLGMIEGSVSKPKDPVICKNSYWLRVDKGGILHVYPELLDQINEDEKIAHLTDIFGRFISDFESPENGIVIGKSTNPVTYTGGRILHLGIQGSIDDISEQTDDIDDDDY